MNRISTILNEVYPGVSLEEIANDLSTASGIHYTRQAISQWRRGKTQPSLDRLGMICRRATPETKAYQFAIRALSAMWPCQTPPVSEVNS